MYKTLEFYATDCGFQNGCAKCRQVYEKGPVVVLVVADHTHYFMLGMKPDQQHTCCGEKKTKQVAVFESSEVALAQTTAYEQVFKQAPDDADIQVLVPMLKMDDVAEQIAAGIGLVRPSGTVQ